MNALEREKSGKFEKPNQGGQTTKKWYWALGTIVIIIVILIITLFILPGAKGGSVSNLYIIPAGTFSPFHETNIPTEQDVMGNISGCISETGMIPDLTTQTNASINRSGK